MRPYRSAIAPPEFSGMQSGADADLPAEDQGRAGGRAALRGNPKPASLPRVLCLAALWTLFDVRSVRERGSRVRPDQPLASGHAFPPRATVPRRRLRVG